MFKRAQTKQINTDRVVKVFSRILLAIVKSDLKMTIIDVQRITKDPTARTAPHVPLPTSLPQNPRVYSHIP